MNNLEEMDRFLEMLNLPRLTQEETKIMSNPITSTEIEAVINFIKMQPLCIFHFQFRPCISFLHSALSLNFSKLTLISQYLHAMRPYVNAHREMMEMKQNFPLLETATFQFSTTKTTSQSSFPLQTKQPLMYWTKCIA